MRQWSAVGTPRIVGRGFPGPPGVALPRIAEDGSGPLDLGLEPPRKRPKGGKEGGGKDDSNYTIQQAMQLKLTSKPWNDDEDKKLCTAVTRFGSADRAELEKAMKRGWGSITARIKNLQAKGLIPAGVVPPAPGAAGSGGGAGSSAPKKGAPASGGATLRKGADGQMHLSPQAIDAKLWEGAASSGWDIIEGKARSWKYISPMGDMCKSREDALATAHSLSLTKMSKGSGVMGPPVLKASAGKAGKSGSGRASRPSKAAKASGGEGAGGAGGGEGDGEPPEKLTKVQAKGLVGKYIEIFWDGEAEWFEAEVLAYDDSRKKHYVRYTADSFESEENLMHAGVEPAIWRNVIKTTSRGAAVKAKNADAERRATGFVVPQLPVVEQEPTPP